MGVTVWQWALIAMRPYYGSCGLEEDAERGHIKCEYAQIVPGKLFLKLLVEAGLSTVFWIQQFYFK